MDAAGLNEQECASSLENCGKSFSVVDSCYHRVVIILAVCKLLHNLQSYCDLINPTAGAMLGRRGKYRPTGEDRRGTKEERRIIPVPAHTNNKDNTGIYDVGKICIHRMYHMVCYI